MPARNLSENLNAKLNEHSLDIDIWNPTKSY
jgi:hypothetical protein